ncbi:MAG TPA: hypothetical protein VG497_10315 [Kribbella sp.]|nr:hypothetical protein [Kribbella sp.]
MTDYRARIREALEDAYEGIDCEVDERHDAATEAVADILRDLTRDLSEQVAQLRLADADRAARELGVGETSVLTDKPVLLNGIMRVLVESYGFLPLNVRMEAATAAVGVAERWVMREVAAVRPSPDAVSTPPPAPASETARQGDDEAHSGSQGAVDEEPECTGGYPYPPEVWTGHHPNCWLVGGGPGPDGSQGSGVDRG